MLTWTRAVGEPPSAGTSTRSPDPSPAVHDPPWAADPSE